MGATAILNPYSNRWNTGNQTEEIKTILKDAGIEFELKVSEYHGHAIELAREAVETGNTPLIAIGGDGTISEVVNGLMQAIPPGQFPAGPIGILPCGTGNDLPDMLGLPRDLREAAQIIARGHTRTIDLGMVNGRYFDNNSAVGLEPIVTLENERLTWLKGNIRYMVSAVIAILKKPFWDVEMEWDEGTYKGTMTLISVGNSARTGGVFFMTPDASLSDGQLDFIFAPALSRRSMFKLLPKTQTGEHIHEPMVHMHRTTKLTIKTNPGTPIQSDGEMMPETKEITYEILPSALKVFFPDKDV
ncbi:MAG: diacylglycerol kinase family lipid kinase [Anaerolineaceae bacterium]|nr:diacylglycerol kinase family lipid kinase [Anaerolineaceae bacterium]